MAAEWDHVAWVWSRSRPDVRYEVKRRPGTRELGCSCPAWRFHKARDGERTCKHIRAWEAEQARADAEASLARAVLARPVPALGLEARLAAALLECAPELGESRRRVVARTLAERLGVGAAPAAALTTARAVREVVLED